MAGELTLEDVNGRPLTHIGDEQALPTFFRLVRGMPSSTQTVVVRNTLEDRTFRGRAVVTPAAGKSFAGDLEVRTSERSSEHGWGRSVPVEIPPLDTLNLYVRVLPISTPDGQPGKAGCYLEGDFFTGEGPAEGEQEDPQAAASPGTG